MVPGAAECRGPPGEIRPDHRLRLRLREPAGQAAGRAGPAGAGGLSHPAGGGAAEGGDVGVAATVILDVTRTDSIAAATAWVKEQVGDKGLWGLVNNAGIAIPFAPNEWLTKDDFVKVLEVNLIGLIEVTLSVLPLVKRARGRVVNYGMEAFSDSLRREMLPFGVKVCVIEPGYFHTAITNPQLINESSTRLWERLPDETKASYGESYLHAFIRATHSMQKYCHADLSIVTGCMGHALMARHPRTRYSAGWDAKLLFLPLSYLPTWFADFVLTWSYPVPAQKV
ncbi:retinol dehydrogenase 16 (all-trans) [Chelydra serpentina]|uniref:Retinol dehydrogenase 16 (All-trans) n=1 Tax=Chelydra serpentina TaxID=8475 RepID=A0A8T1T691_CHESE|nr:retinol dehydrogenase 16 (all-trans) [Chelydra serpentina]